MGGYLQSKRFILRYWATMGTFQRFLSYHCPHTSAGSESTTGLCHRPVTARLELTILICCRSVVCFLLNKPCDKTQVCLSFFFYLPPFTQPSELFGVPLPPGLAFMKTSKINDLSATWRLLFVDNFNPNSTWRTLCPRVGLEITGNVSARLASWKERWIRIELKSGFVFFSFFSGKHLHALHSFYVSGGGRENTDNQSVRSQNTRS